MTRAIALVGPSLALLLSGCNESQQPSGTGLVNLCAQANETDGCDDTPVACAWDFANNACDHSEGRCRSNLGAARAECEGIIVQCPGETGGAGVFIEPLMCAQNAYGTHGGTAAGWQPGGYVYYDPATGVYMVDTTLFDELIADPQRIIWDSARVDATAPYFRLTDVASGDLVDLLGLQDDDKFISVNSYSLKYDLDVMIAFEENAEDTEFELKVYNWGLGGMRTQYYELY